MTEKEPAGPKRNLRYEPLTQLATGGMAEIWLARERGVAGLERFVVIKRLLPHLASDQAVVEMFVSEARFVARLVHPNVVQIHELAEDDQGYFLVMEYVAGCTVRELMAAAEKSKRSVSPDVAVCVIEQACRGAHAAHELTDGTGKSLGLVHRDISPHNLMISPSGDVKLLDFGIAKATALAEATHTGSLKGKFGYMSPEQCRARRLDRRSDVFALGVVLWELLAAKRLFVRDSEFESMQAIVSGEHVLPSEVRSEIPSPLDAVVSKALHKDTAGRWQTAEEMRVALVEAAEQAGMRPSRDAVGAALVALLGDRIEQRDKALRDAAERNTDAIDRGALQAALVGPDSSEQRSGSRSFTGRSVRVSDDGATVVQRRSSRPVSRDDLPGESADERPSLDESPLGDNEPTIDRTPFDKTFSQGNDARSNPGSAAETPRAPAVDTPALPESMVAHSSAPLPAPSSVSSTVPIAPKSIGRIVWALVGVVALGAIALWAGFTTGLLGHSPAISTGVEPTAAPRGPPLRFVVPPTVQPEVIRRELGPFTRWLGVRIDRPVVVVIASSYEDAGDKLVTGDADVGLVPPLLYVQTAARDARIRPLALRLYDGSRGSDGYFLVRDDAPIATASDLRGRTVCLVDRESTTGWLLPRIWMRRAGLDPDRDLTTRLSGDHLAALRDLSNRRCEGAAVYSGAYLSAGAQGIRVGAMRVLGITGRVPQDVVAASARVSAAGADAIRRSLLEFEPNRDIDASRIGAVLGISGFAPFEQAELDVVREAAAAEGLLAVGDAGAIGADAGPR